MSGIRKSPSCKIYINFTNKLITLFLKVRQLRLKALPDWDQHLIILTIVIIKEQIRVKILVERMVPPNKNKT